MKTLLICHEGAGLNQQGITRWLASFSDLVGVVVLRETRRRLWRRIRREVRRVGLVRFCDVLAFRAYYRFLLSRRDEAWQREKLAELCSTYPPLSSELPVLHTHSPNTSQAEQFMREHAPDIVIARCKTLLKEKVFSIPCKGTFVFHPGICPEYRNAHGCFWALANGDLENVGMTILRIDNGVDTGPVYGYYSYEYDEITESPIVIQHRVVLENLDRLRDTLIEIYHGSILPLDTSGRPSNTWGQPWLTSYLQWKRAAKRRIDESDFTSLSRRR